MSTENKRIILGLTGSFGSGCRTLMKALEQNDFKGFSLSKYVREEWERKNEGKSSQLASRQELQDIGNSLRKDNGNNYLAKEAIKEAEKVTQGKESLVFRGIRNRSEVQELQKIYPDFFLIAIDCSPALRWVRIKPHYEELGLTEYDFQNDDGRDKYEEGKNYGQQVQLCVDAADIAISNDENFPDENVAIDKLKIKIGEYLDLITGKEKRIPTPMESYMNEAYIIAANSRCIKRKVGAIIVDEKNDIVLSTGYNEAPKPAEACALKFVGRCYRDIYKQNYFRDLEKRGQKCPKCEEKLVDIVYPFHCKKCNFNLDKHFIRDKALNRCRALHAEEKAILGLGIRNTEGLTLYTTTFPCFSCAKKIVYGKFENVVYVEPYPDEESIEVLKEVRVAVNKFEGVKARAYFRLFGSQ